MAATQVRGGQLKDGDITDADVATANKDGTAGTPSLRTLGTGATQAAQGSTAAPLASPTFTGIPAAPTAGVSTNTTQLATTAYVMAQISNDALIRLGKAGGQTVYGGTQANDGLSLYGSSNGTGGAVLVGAGGVYFIETNSPAQITANQNNYNPSGFANTFCLRLTTDAARTITGIQQPLYTTGRVLQLVNIGTFDITLPHESVSSTTTNRFNFPNNQNVILKPNGSLYLFYDANTIRWRQMGFPGQYVYGEGIAGGQTIYGGTGANDNLALYASTNNGGAIVLQSGLCLNALATATQLTADTNDLAPASAAWNILSVSANAAWKLTGLTPPSSLIGNGQTFVMFNTSDFPITFVHESTASSAANRFSFANRQDFVLGGQAGAVFFRDSATSRWRAVGDSREMALPTKYRQGLFWSRNTGDTTNKIDVTAGSCRSDDDTYNIILTATVTKSLAGTWVVGSGSNGLDTGARANTTWYYIWAIARPDTAVCDILLSVSKTAPTLPTNYTKKRLIGAIHTGASLLDQVLVRGCGAGIYVLFVDPVTVGFAAASTTLSTTRTDFTAAGVPPLGTTGDFIMADFHLQVTNATAGTMVYVSNPQLTDSAPADTGTLSSTLRVQVANQLCDIRCTLPVDHTPTFSARSSAASTTFRAQCFGYQWPGQF